MVERAFWALILLLVATPVGAHGFLFTWTDPTVRTDNTPLDPATELQAYRMRCEGAENAERIVDRAATTALTGNQRQYDWTDAVTASGLYDCKMTALDTGDRESDWSNVASVQKYTRPAPPTDFRTE